MKMVVTVVTLSLDEALAVGADAGASELELDSVGMLSELELDSVGTEPELELISVGAGSV
jgi:hypothetical protein